MSEISKDIVSDNEDDYSELNSGKWYTDQKGVRMIYRCLIKGCCNRTAYHKHGDEETDEDKDEKDSIFNVSESINIEEMKPEKKIDAGGTEFSSSIGIFFSCIGSVVGSGNIWRFPRICAQNSYDEGALAFLVVWLFSLFLWSIPIIIIEYTMGRFTRAGPLVAFGKFFGTKMAWVGGWIVMVAFFISCYYNVIVGWCLFYVYHSIEVAELPQNETESVAVFNEFTQNSDWPILCHTISLVIVSVCIFGGLKWIEMVNSALVTLLAIIIVITFGWALSLQYSDVGIQYLFTPNWDSLSNPNLWIDAFIQNAFDTGAGLGHYAVYSAFFKRTDGSVIYAITLPMLNNLVSMVCGISIFGTVFATMIKNRPTLTTLSIQNLMKESGPASTGLTFTWIPVLYETMGVAGRVLCGLFFICLSFAGLTTQISNLQLTTVTLKNFGINHYVATTAALLATFLIGVPAAISITFLTNQDFVWGFALIISGVLFTAMVSFYGAERYRRHIVNSFGVEDWYLFPIWTFIVVVFIPIMAAVFIVWWALGLLINNPEWNSLGPTSFFTVILEWLGLFLVLLIINILVIKCNWNIFRVDDATGYDPYHLEKVPPYNPDAGMILEIEDGDVPPIETF